MFRAAMLFALSTGHKIGLAATGAAFIIFALVSAMVIPRFSPEFPGKNLRWYIMVCVAFFVAMISAVLVFGKEKKKAEAATPSVTQPAPPSSAAPAGNPTAGKVVFNGASGCAGCHTFKAAAATGAVGPDLDKLAAEAAAAKQPLAAFTRDSIVNPDAYIAPGYSKGIMPTSFGTMLSKTQVDDLVAFLDQGH
jgi:mono/diheme cytochrome c family protein